MSMSGICASRTTRGTGRSSPRRVSWLSVERDSRPDKLRSKDPINSAIRFSPAAMTSSNVLGHVRDRFGSDGILMMGSSSSDGGDLGEWKVAAFRKGILVSTGERH